MRFGEHVTSLATTDAGKAIESEVWNDFDAVFRLHDKWFTVIREVEGWYISGRSHVQPKRPRIDRILLPTANLRGCGWDLGPVGIECKRQGDKLGPAVCQAIDYSHAVFPITGGLTVNLEWIFVWPVSSVSGDVASIMSQNRIGWASSWNGVDVQLKAGDCNALDVTPSSIISIKTPKCGYKVGSR